MMPGLKAIIDALEPVEGGWRGAIPDNWLQGRTAYGGLSAALALHAAQQSDADLPPLRSALVAFIGPLSGDDHDPRDRLRRGRNAAFIQADVESEAGLGLRATFVFMGAGRIEGRLRQSARAPDFARPDARRHDLQGRELERSSRRISSCSIAATRPSGRPNGCAGCGCSEREGLDPMVELIAIADCLPPAALKLIGGPAPVSSMTWQLNVLGPQPTTTDGWWLLRADADYAKDGSSSQEMTIWNADGEPIAEQMQSVAIFA